MVLRRPMTITLTCDVIPVSHLLLLLLLLLLLHPKPQLQITQYIAYDVLTNGHVETVKSRTTNTLCKNMTVAEKAKRSEDRI
jgi:uncharacterized membrane protein